MKRKSLIIVLFILTVFTLGCVSAQDCDNVTDISQSDDAGELQEVSSEIASASNSLVKTQINVTSDTSFDVIGDYFKVNLSDENNNSLSNVKVTFKINGVTYTRTTDLNGIASLQLRLSDGSYKIDTKFAGNSLYQSSSLTTTITMNNTRVVDSGLSNSEIQQIIDEAKANNVILFKGKSYSNINLIITKSLTLMSSVDTTLKSSSSSPVISVKGSKASLTTIKGFNIKGEGNGIYINGADYVTVFKNDITTEGNGIVATGTKYLNITKNNIVKNSKNGAVITNSTSVYIFNNKISNNGGFGIGVAGSNKIYIHGNTLTGNGKQGVYFTNTLNGATYPEGSRNIHITQNDISKNTGDGIEMLTVGDNINIKSNSIESNKGNGISLGTVGSNSIQSNTIISNWENGIQFYNYYVKPKNQEISYNAIFDNMHMDVEAKETYYQENGEKLKLGDNWYTDFNGVCPKISTNNIRFTVTQVGPNLFQAAFYDSNGDVASLLPDRTLSYQIGNGKSQSMTISGGIATFTVDANDADLIKSVVDYSRRENTFDFNTKTVPSTNGVAPSYSYPDIPQYEIYEDIGGNGTGEGSGGIGSGSGDGTNGTNTEGNSQNSQQNSRTEGNSTTTQNQDPSSNQANPIQDVSQSADVSTSAAESASESGSASGQSDSVVKQILLDEDDIVRVMGISFIVLLMILTVGFYYRDDIREMKSKM